jgi:CheY-like chemotaxis protein
MAKILAVEDEALVRAMVVETLESAGHTVLDAPDGLVALSVVKTTPDLDIIVTDVRMPNMDGFSLATQARALRPAIALLFMTGYTGAAIPGGFSAADVLQKPFDPDDLVARVERTLRRSRPPR